MNGEGIVPAYGFTASVRSLMGRALAPVQSFDRPSTPTPNR